MVNTVSVEMYVFLRIILQPLHFTRTVLTVQHLNCWEKEAGLGQVKGWVGRVEGTKYFWADFFKFSIFTGKQNFDFMLHVFAGNGNSFPAKCGQECFSSRP